MASNFVSFQDECFLQLCGRLRAIYCIQSCCTLILFPLPHCLGKNKMSGVPVCQAEPRQTPQEWNKFYFWNFLFFERKLKKQNIHRYQVKTERPNCSFARWNLTSDVRRGPASVSRPPAEVRAMETVLSSRYQNICKSHSSIISLPPLMRKIKKRNRKRKPWSIGYSRSPSSCMFSRRVYSTIAPSKQAPCRPHLLLNQYTL